jgi:hypothetical protein
LDSIHDKWIKYMLKVKAPLQEKLVLFWHDHFATGIAKVFDAKMMSIQNKLFRANCRGNFKTLVKAVNVDPGDDRVSSTPSGTTKRSPTRTTPASSRSSSRSA